MAPAVASPATARDPWTIWSAVFDAIRNVSGPQIAIEIVTSEYIEPLTKAPVRAHSGRSANESDIVPLIDAARLCHLTEDPADDYAAEWSPDGSMLVFVRGASRGTSRRTRSTS